MAGFDLKVVAITLVAAGLAGCGTTSAPVPQIPSGVTGGVAIGSGAIAPTSAQPAPAPSMSQPTQPVVGTAPVAAAPGFGAQTAAPVAGASAQAGMWELRNDGGETCQVNLSTTPMGGSFQASPSGACSMSFGTVAAWSEANGQLFLFDGRNTLLGRFLPNGVGGYSGTFGDGVFASSQATLRRL